MIQWTHIHVVLSEMDLRAVSLQTTSIAGEKKRVGKSPASQGLGLCAFTAKGPGSIPGWGTKIPQAAWCGQKHQTKPNKYKLTTNPLHPNNKKTGQATPTPHTDLWILFE